MNRLMLAGFVLAMLPTCVSAGDFQRALIEAHVDLQQTEALSGPSRSSASRALLERLDALEHATRTDTRMLEKVQRLNALARLQLAQGGRITPLDLPTAVPTFRQPGTVGESCEAPLPLTTGEAITLDMRPGESVWVRIQGTEDKAIGLTTRGSGVDTRLSAWADCRELVAEPFSTADDSVGLLAELALATDRQTFWLVRLDNLSDQPGPVTLSGVGLGLVQGTVTRSADGAPAADVMVGMFRAVNGQYEYNGSAQANAQGQYQIGYQTIGAYVLRTGGSLLSSPSFAHEAWNNVPCVSSGETTFGDCTLGQTQPTRIQLSGNSATVNFELDSAGAVAGLVTDADSSSPLPDTRIRLTFNESDDWNTNVYTDAFGRYQINRLSGLESYLIAEKDGYLRQLFNGVDCPLEGCDLAQGRPIRNDPSAPVMRADFRLSRQPSLGVQVRIDGFPTTTSDYFTLTLFDAVSGVQYSRTFYGPQVSLVDYPAGSYRIRIESNQTYSQLYDGIECAESCMEELSQAVPVTFPVVGTSQTIQFNLRALPSIRGSIRDEADGALLTTTPVALIRPNGSHVDGTYTDEQGRFTLPNIRPGSYLLVVSSGNHVREVYDDIPCPPPIWPQACAGTTLLNFTRESSDLELEIELTPNPRVAGRVALEDQAQIDYIYLHALGPNGEILKREWARRNVDGTYTTQAFATGSMRFGAHRTSYWPQVFPQIDCLAQGSINFTNCDLSNATVLQLLPGTTTGGIDFRLRPSGRRGFRVVRDADNTPLAGIGIDVWNSAGQRVDTFVSADDGRVFVRYSLLEPWYLSTFNLFGLEDQVFNGIPCPLGPVYFGECSLQGASPIPVPATSSAVAEELVIRMRERVPIFKHGFEG